MRLRTATLLWLIYAASGPAVPARSAPRSASAEAFRARGGSAPAAQSAGIDADELYKHREDLASAKAAADLWQKRSATDFEAAWKLARACYWLGTHGPESERRNALERGVKAGETGIHEAADRPEAHFWLAANMGELAQSAGLVQGLKYRGRIKEELERVLAIDPKWQSGSALVALGQWYFKVPRLFGGSRATAEELLRRALTYDPENKAALWYLADVVLAAGRKDEARALLQRLLAAPIDPDWAPEDKQFDDHARQQLQALDRRS